MSRPDFIDNQGGNTLAGALDEVLKADAEGGAPAALRIATAFFNPHGFQRLSRVLQSIPEVRLLLGADPAEPFTFAREERLRRPGEKADAFERRRVESGLTRIDKGLRWERDHLPFGRVSHDALRELVALLRSETMQVRRYERAFLHAKAYIFSGAAGSPARAGLIAGSSNLTRAGLERNLELNLGRYDAEGVQRAQGWFDALWDDAAPYDLAALFEEALADATPFEIFIRVLLQLYGDEVRKDEEETRAEHNIPLTNFQMHGVHRALRLIEKWGGAIVADEVGLGKSYIAGEVLKRYHERRQHTLLLCPAELRDTTWKKFREHYKFEVGAAECLSYEQLANDEQLNKLPGEAGGRRLREHLNRPLDDYQLVVIDEAHNYRSPSTPTRAAVLRRLLYGKIRRDLLLLTATPVNNSLWDLFHLLRFFLRQDAALADQGILSIRERFQQAMRENPDTLSPDLLYPVIDATTVKRTRQFVKKHYSRDTITGQDGEPQEIVFPEPKVLSVRYKIEDLRPGLFEKMESALTPDGEEAISFVRYTPEAWQKRGEPGGEEEKAEEDLRAQTMVGLLRTGLLKRFESSAHAFRKTVRKMASEHEAFLKALDKGRVVRSGLAGELSLADDDDFEALLEGSEESESAAGYQVDELRTAVERDMQRLKELAREAAHITAQNDPKLKALTRALGEIAKQAEREAVDPEDARQKRKVLVFSFFEDTLEWIKDYITAEAENHPQLAPYLGRIAYVSGADSHEGVGRQRAVEGFAPVSMEAREGPGQDHYDLLVSTDVLAEGVNLQQCRNIINFDMPWNPMRLVQRHGRIDRIGSPHPRVFLRTIFPEDRLDKLLKLKQNIYRKLAQAAASIGVTRPIEGSAARAQVFSETREEIERLLLEEDAGLFERGGSAGAAQTGEEYRQTLRKISEREKTRIEQLPRNIGGGMRRGRRQGVFFCALVGEQHFLRFVCTDGSWRALKQPVIHELGTCLRLIECEEQTPAHLPDAMRDAAFELWVLAKEHILAEWLWQSDPKNLQPPVRRINRVVAEYMRKHRPRDVSEETFREALDILESPWPRREETLLRGWFEAKKPEQEKTRRGRKLSEYLVEQILETGLTPYQAPEPKPLIDADEIELLCWLGVEADPAEIAAAEARASQDRENSDA